MSLETTCTYCNLVCKSKPGLTRHLKSCKVKNNINIPTHKTTVINKNIYSFIKDIDWTDSDIPNTFFIECCLLKEKGIIELFRKLHEHPNHFNIRYSHSRIIVFDGRNWVKLQDEMIRDHLGFLFSILEEKWCDFLMELRCGNIDNTCISEEDIEDTDTFFYNKIVDDDSVLFYCKDLMYDYIEELKK